MYLCVCVCVEGVVGGGGAGKGGLRGAKASFTGSQPLLSSSIVVKM